MASAAGQPANGGSSNPHNDLACVHRAVSTDATADQVRAILNSGPRPRSARSEWLKAVVNYKHTAAAAAAAAGPLGPGPLVDSSPLLAAHQRRDGPVVGLLLEHGADACALGPNANALALCIAYGQANTLRILLRSGRHGDPNEKVAYQAAGAAGGAAYTTPFCRLAHLCVVPPQTAEPPHVPPPPQLECLDVLVREFGADVNALTDNGSTPLHWLAMASRAHQRAAFDALLALGADVHARSGTGKTPIFSVVMCGDVQMVRDILGRGASPNAIDAHGFTPLLSARFGKPAPDEWGGPEDPRREMLAVLLPLSSAETRRSKSGASGRSALDLLFEKLYLRNPEPWERRAIEELLSSRVPVQPRHARRALPFAARLAERRTAEADRRNSSGAMQWRAHEDLFGLAQDFQELREAEARVEAKERRVAELQAELRRRGIGTGDEGVGGGGAK